MSDGVTADGLEPGIHVQPGATATEHVNRIAGLLDDQVVGARRVEVDALTALYEPDTPPRNLYFIHTGQVRVFHVGQDGSARLLEILGPEEWCGIPALANTSAYGTRAVTMSRAVVSEIPADRFMALLPRYPGLAAELIGQLASKLHAAYADAATLVSDDTETRLVRTLLQFGHSAAASPAEPEEGDEGAIAAGSVVLRITHQQLAQAVGAARETVSLALTQLRQQNLVRTGRNRLWFNPQALEGYRLRRATVSAASPGEAVAEP